MKNRFGRNLLLVVGILVSLFPLWSAASAVGAVSITVLYDNVTFQEGLTPDWGFSCLIKAGKKEILYDTGKDSRILFSNIDRLGVDLKSIDQIVVSHLHPDHIGGLFSILDVQPNAVVFLPETTMALGQQFQERHVKQITVDHPIQIDKGIYLTGAMGAGIREQALVIDTPLGLIVMVGCSHPGIVNVIKRIVAMWNRPIYLLMGGFHSMPRTIGGLTAIAEQLKQLGVKRVGPAHCSSEQTKAFFRAAYGKDYVAVGAGKVLTLSSDKAGKKNK